MTALVGGPGSWLERYRSCVHGLGFGAQLGAGITTVVVTSSVCAVIAAWPRDPRGGGLR